MAQIAKRVGPRMASIHAPIPLQDRQTKPPGDTRRADQRTSLADSSRSSKANRSALAPTVPISSLRNR